MLLSHLCPPFTVRKVSPGEAAGMCFCCLAADLGVRGAGIGGLCCAALLSHYGLSVTVCEAHYHAGGAAHGFDMQGYQFDAGIATASPCPATAGLLLGG